MADNLNDTIVSLSTPPGLSAIAVIRISGEKSLDIISNIFGIKKEKISEKLFRVGWAKTRDGKRVDQCLFVYFKSPHSFTGEDMAEIHCHGGQLIIKTLLSEIQKLGARIAERGEFSKRAFLNGKIDLIQAEAIMEAIFSKSQLSMLASVDRLSGGLSKRIMEIYDGLKRIAMEIEAAVDFPDDVDEPDRGELANRINEAIHKIVTIIENSEKFKGLFNGYTVVIIGKPNVGKSSLLNAIVKKERAIVTDIPGTTTDILESNVVINDIPFVFFDTAGIRAPKNKIEEIGISKSFEMLDQSDIVLVVFDSSQMLDEIDFKVLNKVYEYKSVKTIFAILNKCDLKECIDDTFIKDKFGDIIKLSAKTGSGIEILENKLTSIVNCTQLSQISSDIILSNERQISHLRKAAESLKRAYESAIKDIPIDMVSIDLIEAISEVGNISGVEVSDHIIKGIFENFCIGK